MKSKLVTAKLVKVSVSQLTVSLLVALVLVWLDEEEGSCNCLGLYQLLSLFELSDVFDLEASMSVERPPWFTAELIDEFEQYVTVATAGTLDSERFIFECSLRIDA